MLYYPSTPIDADISQHFTTSKHLSDRKEKVASTQSSNAANIPGVDPAALSSSSEHNRSRAIFPKLEQSFLTHHGSTMITVIASMAVTNLVCNSKFI